MLVSVRRDGVLAAAALCTPPRDLIVSGLPADCAAATVEVLASTHLQLPGAVGPRTEAEAFAQTWAAATGASVYERVAQRVFALHQLTLPSGVPGAARPAGASDLELLAGWRQDFADEATGGLRGHGTALKQMRSTLAAGTAAMLWEVGGQPVAWASASAPVVGMSRIGPVYTPPQYRGDGYGSAVTAAAASWALQSHAKHVVLSTDLLIRSATRSTRGSASARYTTLQRSPSYPPRDAEVQAVARRDRIRPGKVFLRSVAIPRLAWRR